MAYYPLGLGLGVYCADDMRNQLIDELSSIRVPDSSEHLFESYAVRNALYGPNTIDGPNIFTIP